MGNRAQRRTLRTFTAGVVLAGAFLAAGGVQPAGASTGDPSPEVYGDLAGEENKNPTCLDMGYDYGFKLEPQGIPVQGTVYNVPADEDFLPDGATITITRVDTEGRVEFDWTSSVAWSAVMVKQADGGLIYRYDPARTSDEGVQTTVNNSDGISHVNFCGPGEPPAEEPCEYDAELAADDPACLPPEVDPCEYDPELSADDPACLPPEVDPCQYDPSLEADDPACLPPAEGDPCVYDAELSADDPLCVAPSTETPPEEEEILPNTVVRAAALPRTGSGTGVLAAVGTGLVLLGAALVELQRRKASA